MLSTKNLIVDVKEVPVTWIFEYYCQLDKNLDGESIKINSVFNAQDDTPSMFIFPAYGDNANGTYVFNCYSSGKSGSAIKLVEELYGLTFAQAAKRIVSDYNKYVLKYGKPASAVTYQASVDNKFRVCDYKLRQWNEVDAKFWLQFNISSKILEYYNVKPLENYLCFREKDGCNFLVKGEKIYGYFTQEGELYKIYTPGRDIKFFTIRTVVQGYDQLRGYDYLLIGSSLKDIMSIRSFNLRVDLVAAPSENTPLPEWFLEEAKTRYKHIAVMYDNDEEGIKAMKKARECHGFTPILLPLSKDVSDSVRDYKANYVKTRLIPLLDRVKYELQCETSN